ncbi:MAG: fibronectin type III domain-containing protein, partial [Ferruginibacter sp.]
MRKIYLLVIAALLLFNSNSFAQCLTAGNGQWPTATFVPTCTGSPETITTVGFAGEYSVVTVTNGVTYTFTSSIATDYITVGNTAGTIAYAFGTTPVVWTATFSGDIRFYTHVNAACAENTTSRTRAIQCSLPACVAPANSPTGLVLTPISPSQINGSFTAAAGSPSGYLVVRYPAGSATTNPVNGTTYTAGGSLGAGKIVSSAAVTTFSATGLAPSTAYDFYVYSYNNTACTGGPVYKLTAPLTGTSTSQACAGLAAGTYTVGPTGTYASLTAVATALSGGTAGPVIFELQSTYVSSVETFPINFTSAGCPITGGVTIRPQAGATALSITSANTTGTINLNGISNITFDGRAGGVGASQLTISNTATAGYTVQFINSATFNTIKYCTVSGVNTGTASGVIFFNNAVGLTTGNSNNT